MFGTASVCRLNRGVVVRALAWLRGDTWRSAAPARCCTMRLGLRDATARVKRKQPTHHPSSPLRGIATGVAADGARADGGRLLICGVVPGLLPGTVPLTITPYKQSLPQPYVHNPTPTAITPRPRTHQPRSPLARHCCRGCWQVLVFAHLVGRTVLGAPLLSGFAHTCRSRTHRRGRRPRRPLRRTTGNLPGRLPTLPSPPPPRTSPHCISLTSR